MDHEDLDASIRSFENLVNTGDINFRDARTLSSQIFQHFKDVRYPSGYARQDAWLRFKTLHDKFKQEERDAAEDAYYSITKNLKSLEENIGETVQGERSWNDVWASITQLSNLLKSTPYRAKCERDGHWNDFHKLVERAKAEQEALRKQRTEREEHSDQLRAQIIYRAELARPPFGWRLERRNRGITRYTH